MYNSFIWPLEYPVRFSSNPVQREKAFCVYPTQPVWVICIVSPERPIHCKLKRTVIVLKRIRLSDDLELKFSTSRGELRIVAYPSLTWLDAEPLSESRSIVVYYEVKRIQLLYPVLSLQSLSIHLHLLANLWKKIANGYHYKPCSVIYMQVYRVCLMQMDTCWTAFKHFAWDEHPCTTF